MLDSFANLAADRNDCYTYHCTCHGDGSDNDIRINYLKARGWKPTKTEYIDNYRDYAYSYFGYDLYVYECQTTAYFMQWLAILAAKKNIPTALTDIAKKYEGTKRQFIEYSVNIQFLKMNFATDYITNPHQQISYYILARS